MDNTLNKPAEDTPKDTLSTDKTVDENDAVIAETSRRTGIIICSVFFLILGFGLYKITQNLWDYKPLGEGYFPLSNNFGRGESKLVMGQFFILTMMTMAAVGIVVFLPKAFSIVKSFFAVVVVILAIVAGFTLQNMNTKEWEEDLKTWVQSEYGLEYDHITQYHYAGEIGKTGGRGQPSVYITPPENIRYLTAENGKYVAELIPDTYASESIRLYEVSGEGKPKLLSPK